VSACVQADPSNGVSAPQRARREPSRRALLPLRSHHASETRGRDRHPKNTLAVDRCQGRQSAEPGAGQTDAWILRAQFSRRHSNGGRCASGQCEAEGRRKATERLRQDNDSDAPYPQRLVDRERPL